MTKHKLFKSNLISAAAQGQSEENTPSFEVVAHQWHYHGKGQLDELINCQVCHTQIRNMVMIRHSKTEVILEIGQDCFRKLEHFKATGVLAAVTESKVVTPVKPIDKLEKKLKVKPEETFLSWLVAQSNLTEALKQAAKTALALGYPPSVKIAEDLVAFYRAHRKFHLKDLIDGKKLQVINAWLQDFGREWLPEMVTLDELNQLEKQLEEAVELKQTNWLTATASDKIKTLARCKRPVPAIKLRYDLNQFTLSDFKLQVGFYYGSFQLNIPAELMLNSGYSWRVFLAALEETMPATICIAWDANTKKVNFETTALENWNSAAKVVAKNEGKAEPFSEEILMQVVHNGEQPILSDVKIIKNEKSWGINGQYCGKHIWLTCQFVYAGQHLEIVLPDEITALKASTRLTWDVFLKHVANSRPNPLDMVWQDNALAISNDSVTAWCQLIESGAKQVRAEIKRIKREEEQRELEIRQKARLASEARKAQFKRDAAARKKYLLENEEGYIAGTFTVGFNPSRQEQQWQLKQNDKLYVLSWKYGYDFAKESINLFCLIKRELVPGKIYLVEKLYAKSDESGNFDCWMIG